MDDSAHDCFGLVKVAVVTGILEYNKPRVRNPINEPVDLVAPHIMILGTPVNECRHVNLVTKRVPGLPDEQEYLFAPYSVFTVLKATWRAGTNADPHVIELQAAPDNKGPSEKLPLAPWS